MVDPKDIAAAIERLEAATEWGAKHPGVRRGVLVNVSVYWRDLRTVLDAIKELQEQAKERGA